MLPHLLLFMKNYVQTLLYYVWLDLKRIMFRTKYNAEFDVTDNCTSGANTVIIFKVKKTLKHKIWKRPFGKKGLTNSISLE